MSLQYLIKYDRKYGFHLAHRYDDGFISGDIEFQPSRSELSRTLRELADAIDQNALPVLVTAPTSYTQLTDAEIAELP